MAIAIFELKNLAKRAHRGYPVATVAFYGPDNNIATKAVLGIIPFESAEPLLFKYFNSECDIRRDNQVAASILARIREHQAASVVMSEKLFGCPHQEGIDYPAGSTCPQCPYWAAHDRFENIE